MYDSKDITEGSQGDPALLAEFKKQLNDVQLKNFTELMTVKEGGETVKFMIRKDGKIIIELLLLINQEDEAGFISITGNIDLKSIAKLSKSMNIKGMENLQQLEQPKE
jgi:predicted nucleotidyltransferase